MKTYIASFRGKVKKSKGEIHRIHATIESVDIIRAKQKLHRMFENISCLSLGTPQMKAVV